MSKRQLLEKLPKLPRAPHSRHSFHLLTWQRSRLSLPGRESFCLPHPSGKPLRPLSSHANDIMTAAQTTSWRIPRRKALVTCWTRVFLPLLGDNPPSSLFSRRWWRAFRMGSRRIFLWCDRQFSLNVSNFSSLCLCCSLSTLISFRRKFRSYHPT